MVVGHGPRTTAMRKMTMTIKAAESEGEGDSAMKDDCTPPLTLNAPPAQPCTPCSDRAPGTNGYCFVPIKLNSY